MNPAILPPIRNMSCTCCGASTKGRQWWNLDTGYSLCSDCGNRPAFTKPFNVGEYSPENAPSGKYDSEAHFIAGPRGIYWDIN
jgi:hypothetical protein